MNIDSLFSTVFDGATVAAGRSIRLRSPHSEIDYDLYAQVAKPIYTAAIDSLLAEWDVLAQAIVSDETVRQFINAQALELGIKTADAYQEEMFWRD